MKPSKKMKNRSRSLDDPWQISQEQFGIEFPLEPKGKDFWATPDDLCRILSTAGVISSWSMGAALGDTAKEKIGSFLLHINEVSQYLVDKGAKGYFWIAAGPKAIDLIKCCNLVLPNIFRGDSPFETQHQMGVDGVYDEGTLLHKFRIFMCPRIVDKHFLIGVNNSEQDLKHYARVVIRD